MHCKSQETHGVVHALQGTLGVLHEMQMTSVFMHVRQLCLASPINMTMSKQSQHTTREEQQRVSEKESLAQKESNPHENFPCRRNREPTCESVLDKLRDIL